MMKSPLMLLTLCLMQLVALSQSVAIQPSILDYRLSSGSRETQVVRISNLSDKKLSFEAYLADWLRDSTGAHEYFRPDTLKRSCATWVSLDKNFIEIAPQSTAELLVSLNYPANGSANDQMKWAMLFLQSANERDSAEKNNKNVSTQVKELIRVGIHIYQTPPTANKLKGKLNTLTAVENESRVFELTMENTGDAMLQCKAHLELTNIETGKEFRLDKIEFPIFPEGKRNVKFTVPSSVPPGKYAALAILDIGEDHPLEAIEKNIELK